MIQDDLSHSEFSIFTGGGLGCPGSSVVADSDEKDS